MPVSTPPVNNAKSPSIKGEPRRGKPKGKSAKSSDGSGAAEGGRTKNGKDARANGKSGGSRQRDGLPRRPSPAVAVPSSSGDAEDGSKYSGSTFHLSPNASSLPRPPFKGKNGSSPPLNGTNTPNNGLNGMPNNMHVPTAAAPPPPQMMYRPAPQYGMPYGAFPGYPSGAYPPVMHTPMGMVPPSGVPAYGGHIGASPMGPIAGFPPMVMNAPPQSNVPH